MKQQYNHSVEKRVGLIKIAIDMHLKSFRVVRQMDQAWVQPAQRFEPARFYQWLEKEKQKARGVGRCATRQVASGMSRRGAWERWE